MNQPSIYVRNAGSTEPWTTPDATTYEWESDLQELLATEPSRIEGVPHGSMAVRELSTSAGPVDICVVSPVGDITVVECKLQRSSEPRRMVLGQVIDYASAIHIDGREAFDHAWTSRGGLSLESYLDPDSLKNLSENIQLGRLHLALAVDRIDDDLRRLIEFLNLISRDDIRVTALQLSYVRHGDLEMLIPSTFGGEIAGSKGVRSQSHVHWTWDDFISSLTSPSDQELAQTLQDLAEQIPSTGSHEKFWFGRQPNGGIFFHIHGGRFAPFQLWRSRSGELRVFGNWTIWPSLQNDDGFAYIANALSQSHLHGARSIPVHSLDINTFWMAAVATDLAINT